jgi:hypothetical protein
MRGASDAFLQEVEALEPDDLERLAVSAFLVGRNDESDAAWAQAYGRRLDGLDVKGAVRCAFWLGFRLVNARQWPEANAWIARIERLVPEPAADGLDRARLDYLTGLRIVFEGGDLARAANDLRMAADQAARRDEELASLARLSLGRVQIFLGSLSEGVRLLDDAMLAIRSDPFSPIAVGDSHCTAIDTC